MKVDRCASVAQSFLFLFSGGSMNDVLRHNRTSENGSSARVLLFPVRGVPAHPGRVSSSRRLRGVLDYLTGYEGTMSFLSSPFLSPTWSSADWRFSDCRSVYHWFLLAEFQ